MNTTYKYRGTLIEKDSLGLRAEDFDNLDDLEKLVFGQDPILMTEEAIEKYAELVSPVSQE